VQKVVAEYQKQLASQRNYLEVLRDYPSNQRIDYKQYLKPKKNLKISLSHTDLRRVDGGLEARMKKLENQKFSNLKDYLVNEAIIKGEIGHKEINMLYSKGFRSSAIRFMPHASLQHIKSVDEISLDKHDMKSTFSPAATQTEDL